MKKNNTPFSFFVGIIKPISKLHQYRASLVAQASVNLKEPSKVIYVTTAAISKDHANMLP